MKVEVDVLGSPSLGVLTISVDIRQHLKKKNLMRCMAGVGGGGGRYLCDADPKSFDLQTQDRTTRATDSMEVGN